MQENKYDTIIVGGGIAGLTATAFLAHAGKKVLLIEKNNECGGLVNTFSHNGFHFEAGVRALEDAGIIFPMLEQLGIQLDVVPSKVSVGVEDEILNIEDLDSLNEYQELLIRLYPESDREVRDVIKVIRKVMKHMEVLYGVENPVFKDLKRDTKFIFKQLLPWLPKFIFTVGKINRMNMPVEDYLDSIIKNKSLKDIISQHFFKHTPTFFALSYFSLYLDYFYPKGGVGKLAEVLEDKIKELGGEIKNETLITEVISDTKELKDDRGISYYYDDMIWAADLKTLYTITKTEGLSLNIDKKFKETKELMLSSKGGESVFTLFLELDEPPDSFRSIASGHFFYTPSKKGLGATHTKDLDLILNNFDKTNKQEILTWLDRFVSLNTFEISIPVLKDPDLAPAGKTGVIISLLAEYSLFKKIQDDGWYDEFRNALETRIIEVISKSVYPMLKNKIINQFSFTPISVKNRINSSEGAIVGWSFDQELPVISKIQHSARSVVSPIPSIFHAGQWAYSPAGVPMAILTGKLAANKIIDKK